jgi:hypothetical protein
VSGRRAKLARRIAAVERRQIAGWLGHPSTWSRKRMVAHVVARCSRRLGPERGRPHAPAPIPARWLRRALRLIEQLGPVGGPLD